MIKPPIWVLTVLFSVSVSARAGFFPFYQAESEQKRPENFLNNPKETKTFSFAEEAYAGLIEPNEGVRNFAQVIQDPYLGEISLEQAQNIQEEIENLKEHQGFLSPKQEVLLSRLEMYLGDNKRQSTVHEQSSTPKHRFNFPPIVQWTGDSSQKSNPLIYSPPNEKTEESKDYEQSEVGLLREKDRSSNSARMPMKQESPPEMWSKKWIQEAADKIELTMQKGETHFKHPNIDRVLRCDEVCRILYNAGCFGRLEAYIKKNIDNIHGELCRGITAEEEVAFEPMIKHKEFLLKRHEAMNNIIAKKKSEYEDMIRRHNHIKCSVCLEELSVNDYKPFWNAGNAKFKADECCHDCMIQHVTRSVKSGQSTVKRLSVRGIPGPYDDVNLRHYPKNDVADFVAKHCAPELLEMLTQNMLKQAHFERSDRLCPHCEKFFFSNPTGDSSWVPINQKCQECHKAYQDPKINKGSPEEARACPYCNSVFTKMSGCDSMTCPVCSRQINWAQARSLTKEECSCCSIQ